MNKVAKVLLGMIYLLLLAFLGFGVYFISTGRTGTGFTGVGLFLIGFGLVLLLRMSLFSDESETEKSSVTKHQAVGFRKEDAQVKQVVTVNREDDGKTGTATLYMTLDGLYLENLYPTLASMSYSTLTSVEKKEDIIVFKGVFMVANEKAEAVTISVRPATPLNAKSILSMIKIAGYRSVLVEGA